MANMTKAIRCNCKHEFQDQKYGKDMRVHNKTGQAKSDGVKWRCTVCGVDREHNGK